MNEPVVVILTALDLEYQAVREKLTNLRVHRHPAGTRFEVGRLGDCRGEVALALVGKGNHPAAVLAERAIAEFAPIAVLFVGVAGALWPGIALGDVVVATHVYAYHGGTSEDDGLKARPRVWEISHAPDQIARHLARGGDWVRRLPPGTAVPTVRFGPIAAGEVVQDSRISDHASWVRTHYNDALAIEMEGAGVAQAGHLNNSLPVVVVRGISDRADGSKAATDGINWQPRAAAHAAAFASVLAEELVRDGRGSLIGSRGDRKRGSDMTTGAAREFGGNNQNIALGHARVGVQAGQIFGNVRIGPDLELSTDLVAQLGSLRDEIRRAYRDGRLDESTYSAAAAEIDIATGSLPADRLENRNRLMVALKRLRGLIGDAVELAAKVTGIIAVVRGMS